MNILYCRVSSMAQNTDRQKVNENKFDLVIEDRCSGAVPFFERQGGKKIKKLIDEGIKFSLSVSSVDRMGRDLKDIINSIHFFNQKQISIHFISQGLTTLNEMGIENPISKMVISILGVVSEMERTQSKERQYEGIQIAKLKGVYKGRAVGTREDTLEFLSKPQNKKALDLFKKGYKSSEVIKISELNKNTVSKIKRLGLINKEVR